MAKPKKTVKAKKAVVKSNKQGVGSKIAKILGKMVK